MVTNYNKKNTKMSKYKVSFDENGNHITWDSSMNWKISKQVDNYEFEDTLEYIGYEKGRSALNIKWKSRQNNKTYYSGITMLNNILIGDTKCVLRTRILNDKQPFTIVGKFTFQKQGTSVLLKEVK